MSQLILEISKLSIAERIQLIQEILETISNEADKGELTEGQLKEIENRSESIRSGAAKTTLWDTTEEKLKQVRNY